MGCRMLVAVKYPGFDSLPVGRTGLTLTTFKLIH